MLHVADTCSVMAANTRVTRQPRNSSSRRATNGLKRFRFRTTDANSLIEKTDVQ